MVDPDGHCPPCFGPSISGVTDSMELIANPSQALDKIQLKISVVGMIPGAGEVADLVNAGISAIRGNKAEAFLDLAGAVGPVGSGAAAVNRIRKIAKADGLADATRAGKPFTKKGKQEVIEQNQAQNSGTTTCSACGIQTVPGEQGKSGVPKSKNETQVDHKIPKSKGGEGRPGNGQVLCRLCNQKKGNTLPQ